MFLLLSIILSVVVFIILFSVMPEATMVISFGLIFGILFRILYPLNDMDKRLSQLVPESPKRDKVQEAFERYLADKEKENAG